MSGNGTARRPGEKIQQRIEEINERITMLPRGLKGGPARALRNLVRRHPLIAAAILLGMAAAIVVVIVLVMRRRDR